MQHRGLNSGDMIAGGFFLLLGVGAIAGAVQLQIGTPSEPQPGFFPFLGGVGLVILSALLLVQNWRGHSSGGDPFTEVRRPLLATAGFVAFVVLLDPLGYVLATTALSVVMLLVLGVRLGLGSVLPAILLSVGSYLLFDRVLDVPLPEGILGSLFGH